MYIYQYFTLRKRHLNQKSKYLKTVNHQRKVLPGVRVSNGKVQTFVVISSKLSTNYAFVSIFAAQEFFSYQSKGMPECLFSAC